MNQKQRTIVCPHCGKDVTTIVDEQLRNEVHEQVVIETEAKYKEKSAKREVEIWKEVKSNAEKELNEQSIRLNELRGVEAENERLKRERNELESKYDLKTEKRVNEILKVRTREIEKLEKEKVEMKMLEKDKKIEKLEKDKKEFMEKSSTPLNGLVQEDAIENWLKIKFPNDDIKRKSTGGDCLQTVLINKNQKCGKIYYESKRTKTFQNQWITKLKNDMSDEGAEIGVLVTETMPKDVESCKIKDGVWICYFEEFKFLCEALRESLIDLNKIRVSHEDKDIKMGNLYDYFFSKEFELNVKMVAEIFKVMKEDLDSEKRSFERIWKKREKNIDNAQKSAMRIVGSIEGIGGKTIPLPSTALQLLEEEVEPTN